MQKLVINCKEIEEELKKGCDFVYHVCDNYKKKGPYTVKISYFQGDNRCYDYNDAFYYNLYNISFLTDDYQYFIDHENGSSDYRERTIQNYKRIKPDKTMIRLDNGDFMELVFERD